jgi:hypothetical protein
MKIKESNIRKIIIEELSHYRLLEQFDIPRMDPDVHAGWERQGVSDVMRPRGDSASLQDINQLAVESAIADGDDIDSTLKAEMRESAIWEFSSLFTESLQQEISRFIEENPGIASEGDLSVEKIREIKENAAYQALQEYKATHSNTQIISDYLARVERIIGKPVPPTLKQLIIRYAKDFAYQFVFGFIDNAILILAGAAIDDYIKMAFGAEKLSKVLSADDLDFITDGVGNTISDGVGDLGGGAVERSVGSWSWLQDAATDDQLEIATPFQKLMAKTATFTGVVLGCLVAIPIGILILKGVTALGVTTAAGFGLTSTIASAGLALVAAGLMGATFYQELQLLDKGARDTLDGALNIIMSRVYKERRLRGDFVQAEYPRQDYTAEDFALDVENNRDIVQRIWNQEMDFARLASHEDMNTNEVWRGVDTLSNGYGLSNPNRTVLRESRLQVLAGIN